MEYIWWLYLATRLDAFQTLFGVIAFVSGLIGLAAVIIFLVSHDKDLWSTYGVSKEELAASQNSFRSMVKKTAKWSVIICLFSAITDTMIPSKKDAMFIAGGVGVIEAAKAVKGSEIAKTSVKIVENWLKKQEAAQHATETGKDTSK